MIAVFLGALVAICLWIAASMAPLRLLEELGGDVVAERAAESSAIHPEWARDPIVFVSIDQDAMQYWHARTGLEARARIAGLIRRIRTSGPKVVVLDIVFQQRPIDENDDVAIRKAFNDPGAPLIVAAPLLRAFQEPNESYYELRPLQPYPDPASKPTGLTFASSIVPRSVVRTVRLFQCVYTNSLGWMKMPSIAEAVRDALRGARAPDLQCPDGEARQAPVLFLLTPQRGRQRDQPGTALTWFRTISAMQIDQGIQERIDELKGAIVIIGQDHALTDDNHWTPVGEMPGPLVHANAIASLLHFGNDRTEGVAAKLGIEAMFIAIAATVFLLYWWPVEAMQDRRNQGGRASMPGPLTFVLEIALFLAVAAIAFCAIAAIMIELGAALVLRGIMIGTLVPVIAVALEALVHLGHLLYDRLHAIANWILPRRRRGRGVTGTVAVLLVAASGMPAALGAAPTAPAPVGYLRIEGAPSAVTVEQPSGQKRSGQQISELHHGDTIIVSPARTGQSATIAYAVIYGVGQKPTDGVRAGSHYVVNDWPRSEADIPFFRALFLFWQRLESEPLPPGEVPANSYASFMPWPSSGLAGGEGRIVALDTGQAGGGERYAATELPEHGQRKLTMLEQQSLFEASRPERTFLGFAERTAEAQSPAEVRAAQKGLEGAGYYRDGKIDGIWGPKTSEALRRYEEALRAAEPAATAPLRPDPLIGPGPFLVRDDARMLPLVWQGGREPFQVSERDQASGSVLWSQMVFGRMAQVPASLLPGRARLLVTVAETAVAESTSTSSAPSPGHITSFSPSGTLEFQVVGVPAKLVPHEATDASTPALQLAAAAWLMMSPAMPDWHLEGLRRLTLSAQSNDPEAKAMLSRIAARTVGWSLPWPGSETWVDNSAAR